MQPPCTAHMSRIPYPFSSMFMCVHVYIYRDVEWFLPDRRIPIPDEYNILKGAERLVSSTKAQPNLCLQFDQDARSMFDSFNVMFNTRSNQLRKDASPDAAAEEGSACAYHRIPPHTAVMCHTHKPHHMSVC